MTKRSLRHTVRSVDTIITVAIMPIFTMLFFVYLFGKSIPTGSVKYIDFVTPGVVLMTVVTGIAYAAVRLHTDMQKGMIGRFRTMPIAPSSILGGHAASAVLSCLLSVALVMAVALAVGFRSDASVLSWLLVIAIMLLFTVATTWLAIVFGLLAKSAEGAGVFSYILLLFVFTSPAFASTDSMSSAVRAFSRHQPITPIIETMRSLLVDNTAGSSVWVAIAWCVGLLAVSYVAALRLYNNAN
jgi:ABC-2 type transport system permease protein